RQCPSGRPRSAWEVSRRRYGCPEMPARNPPAPGPATTPQRPYIPPSSSRFLSPVSSRHETPCPTCHSIVAATQCSRICPTRKRPPPENRLIHDLRPQITGVCSRQGRGSVNSSFFTAVRAEFFNCPEIPTLVARQVNTCNHLWRRYRSSCTHIVRD